jgi:hypothetical protein
MRILMIRIEQTGREEQNAVDSGFGGYMDTGIDMGSYAD